MRGSNYNHVIYNNFYLLHFAISPCETFVADDDKSQISTVLLRNRDRIFFCFS